MRTAWMLGFYIAFSSSILWGFDAKELKPATANVEHMWYYDDGSAEICFFQYKFVKPDVERMLEDLFKGYTFYVVAVWNRKGKDNFLFDGATNTFRMYCRERTPQRRLMVYGNVDPWEPFLKRIDACISKINQEIRYLQQLESDWAGEQIISLENSAESFHNLAAVMQPFNCAVGERAWAMVPISSEEHNLPLDSVAYINQGKVIEMKRVALTKPMIDKLELKQRELRARFH